MVIFGIITRLGYPAEKLEGYDDEKEIISNLNCTHFVAYQL
jgi:hypothetical protein